MGNSKFSGKQFKDQKGGRPFGSYIFFGSFGFSEVAVFHSVQRLLGALHPYPSLLALHSSPRDPSPITPHPSPLTKGPLTPHSSPRDPHPKGPSLKGTLTQRGPLTQRDPHPSTCHQDNFSPLTPYTLSKIYSSSNIPHLRSHYQAAPTRCP